MPACNSLRRDTQQAAARSSARLRRSPSPTRPGPPAHAGRYLRRCGPASGASLCVCPWDTPRRARATPTGERLGGRHGKAQPPGSVSGTERRGERRAPAQGTAAAGGPPAAPLPPLPSREAAASGPLRQAQRGTRAPLLRSWPARRPRHCLATGLRKEAEGPGCVRGGQDLRQCPGKRAVPAIEECLESPGIQPITSGVAP